MSKATKRKHVTKEVLDDFVLPEEHQQIVKIAGGRGNNLHDAVTADGESFLVSMPTKFRKNVWIKRGDYVIIDPIEEGDKVKGEIAVILYKEQVKYIKENSLWPTAFSDSAKRDDEQMIPDDMLPPSDDEDNDDDSTPTQTDAHGNTIVNNNRKVQMYSSSDESSDDDEE